MNMIIKWLSLESIADSGLFALQAILLTFFLYYIGVSVFGWFKRQGVPAEKFPVVNRFAVLVAAHNEEAVIGNIVRNLKMMNYPSHLYDIYVIADNCEDDTAAVARENGAIVHERFNKVKRGKGYSLEWMFDKLFKMDKKYDAVCIFDADNLVSPNFLMEMNKQLCMGHEVIQGYLDSKNPHDSWIACNNSIAFWIGNRMFQLPRHYLGLSCILGGTGFVVKTNVLKEIGWGATCLTEDLEFTLKLVLKGKKVHWAHDAVIYDEKPLELPQSWRQRKRWMQGHFDCVKRYLVSLLVKAVKEKDIVALDAALYMFQPVIVVINGFIMAISFPAMLIAGDPAFWTSFALMYLGILFLLLERKVSFNTLKYFITAPFYNLTWVPIIIQGLIDMNKRDWVHTLHTKVLDIDDIEALKKVG
ncbi:MAG: glycosyltransferase family 2 protein [Clostridia bacterium]|nr:glycosyltransferase family 2 protein [Clostridia bacterium]